MGLLDPPALTKPAADLRYLSGTRTAGYSFGGAGSNSSTTSYTEAAQRVPFRLTKATTKFRVHIRNRDYKNDAAGTATLSFTGLYVGEHAISTATGTADGYTGAFTAAPTTVDTAFTLINDAEYVSPWVTAPAAQIKAGKQYLLSMGFTCPAGSVIWRTYGAMFFSTTAGDAAKAGQTATLGSYFASPGLLDIWIEYQFVGNEPIGLFIGDSLTEARTGAAVQSVNPQGQDSGYPQQHAFRSASIATVNAYSGITIGSWALINSTKWTRFPGITPDYVFLWALTNDLGNNVDSVATMQSNFLSVVNYIRTLYGVDIPIFTATILPRSFTGTQETNRTTLNAWLATRPKNIAGCFDFDRAVRNAATVASLDSDFDAGDATHLNTRGYSRLASTMGGRLIARQPS